MSTGITILLVGLMATVLYIVVIFNALVSFRNRVKNAFSQINVQLQRRHELIPNLVEAAKAYMSHEKETLTAVIEARNQAKLATEAAAAHPENASTIKQLMKAETALTGSLGQFFALSENYPEIKADQSIADLMEELTSTENKVSFSRQAYNDAVMNYNTYREQFPNFIVANMGHFKSAASFHLDSVDYKKPIKVSF